jgi:hypothetical protein
MVQKSEIKRHIKAFVGRAKREIHLGILPIKKSNNNICVTEDIFKGGKNFKWL